MTSQSPRTSLLEAATQAAVGLPIGLVVSYAVSWFRLSPAISAALITGLMFVASTARGFWIRRRFAKRDAVIDEWRRNMAAYEARRRSAATSEHIPHGSL
jgi:hypothetical protein